MQCYHNSALFECVSEVLLRLLGCGVEGPDGSQILVVIFYLHFKQVRQDKKVKRPLFQEFGRYFEFLQALERLSVSLFEVGLVPVLYQKQHHEDLTFSQKQGVLLFHKLLPLLLSYVVVLARLYELIYLDVHVLQLVEEFLILQFKSGFPEGDALLRVEELFYPLLALLNGKECLLAKLGVYFQIGSII